MGLLIKKNVHLNYWVCGLIFVILFFVVINVIDRVTDEIGYNAWVLGIVVYMLVMPYVSGRLVDYMSDRWMD